MDHDIREENYNAGYEEGRKAALDLLKTVKENLAPPGTDEDFLNGLRNAICDYVDFLSIQEALTN